MIDVLTLAMDRREALQSEADRLDAFIRMAEELIGGAAPAGGTHILVRTPGEAPASPLLVADAVAPASAADDAAGGTAILPAGASEPVQEPVEDEPHVVLRRVLQEAAEAVPATTGSRLARFGRS